MPTTYDDDKVLRGNCTFEGAVDLRDSSGAGIGATGAKYPAAAGALVGLQVAGGAGSCALVFAATGGSPDLADVLTGAGKLILAYTVLA